MRSQRGVSSMGEEGEAVAELALPQEAVRIRRGVARMTAPSRREAVLGVLAVSAALEWD